MKAIALIGLSGAGKSTVGPLLAQRLGMPHHDVDREIERREGRSITEIFETDGEPHFRTLERDLTIELLQEPGILSLGGGAPMTTAVAQALTGHPVIWLRVEPESAARRIGNDQGRPLLAGQDVVVRLRRMLADRSGTYGALASLAVDTDASGVDSVVDAVAAHAHGFEPGVFMGEVIPVSTGKPYEVRVGWGVSRELAQTLEGRHKIAIIHPQSQREAATHIAATLTSDKTLIEIPEGEAAKTVRVLESVWGELAAHGFTRDDAIVGLGGSAVMEVAGFVAATWMRGIDQVSVPTTLQAMVDTAIGGKTGINISEGSNLVGTFWQPSAVLCDMDYLTHTPPDLLRSGLAEMVKHGFVADARTLQLFEVHTDAMLDPGSPELVEGIARSIRIKASVVSADPLEETSEGNRVGRERLNYGHTLGHAIERHSHYEWSHGDAIAVGMLFAASLSHRLGRAPRALVERHRTLLARLGFPLTYAPDAWPELRRFMGHDKKSRSGALRFVILDDVARAGIVVAPSEELLQSAYDDVSRTFR
ncbi:MAG: 3-dehydroquinate synthase [bacterium]|nr:3-dehydroquinate synthase [bacterium]